MAHILLWIVLAVLVVILPRRVAGFIRTASPLVICTALGTAAALAGLGLILGAQNLATHWQPLGEGAWGGTTDPSLVTAYRLIGAAVLGFGLVLDAIAAARWLASPRYPAEAGV